MSNLINVKGKLDFQKEVISSDLPVLVDFWAPWCMPCRLMAPVLETIASKFEGRIKVVKVDTEQSDNHELAYEFQIQSIPNMKLFNKGKVIKDFIGFRPEEIFTEELKKIIV